MRGLAFNMGRVDIPVGCSCFVREIPWPRSWAEAVYPNLIYWNEVEPGGHFPALEQPALFVSELRDCFGFLRPSQHHGGASR
jgi:epoxide hydrolase